MKLLRPLLFAASSFALIMALPVHAASTSIEETGGGVNQYGVPSVAPVLRQVTPSVVNVSVHVRQEVQFSNPMMNDPIFRRFFNLPEGPIVRESQAVGSGVIVDAEHGYVITNNHVIRDADKIQVTLRDKRTFRAKLVGTDPVTDIAVLKIDATGLTALPLGNSDHAEVGDFVLAIGNPFGLGQTVTSGIVSAIGRAGLGIEGYEDFIQTDASINPGNSGGALIELDGKLIGINTAIIAPSGGNVGVGFAVPVNLMRQVMGELIRHGQIVRGTIGVQVQELTPSLAEALHAEGAQGALISEVDESSPAQTAGLQPGDIITAVNGAPITDRADFAKAIVLAPVNQSLTLNYIRNGTNGSVKVTVMPLPGPTPADGSTSPGDPNQGGQ